ncbi:MAG: PAS domain S-box protein [Betaproteobacteria bacterium]|nr:PAS domain S-box protein [Betaproteobacteria bacterium]
MSLKDLDTPETLSTVPERMQRMLSGESLTFEVENYHKDGHVFSLEVSSSVILSGGEPLVQSFVRDITERKQAEAARASLEAQLRESQKMEAIGTLAGGIAHDFNNALATILGNVELARQDVHANPMALQSLDEIRKAGTRARDLVQQILSFSRRQPTERKLTSLAPIIEESERLLRATLPARVSLDVHCAADVPGVHADATLLQQILINLVTNAMQAMRGGPGKIGIRLDTVRFDAVMADVHPGLRAMHTKHAGDVVRIEVSDDGCGMDAATRARIFEPFFTTKAVNEGTGLGLSVVHGIVETHEGAIEVESQLGKGLDIHHLPARCRAAGSRAG